MNDVDIIIPVCGNKELVEECLESLFPIPDNWGMIVYVSKISDIDGTTKYLYDRKDTLGFTLIDQRKTLSHGSAVNEMLKESKSRWVLHLDSDAKMLDKKFYDWAKNAIVSEKFKVWGRVDGKEPMPDLRKFPRIRLLRTYSWNMLFERKYIDINKLIFAPFTIQGTTEGTNLDNKDLLIWGDTSWEYFWKASKDDLFGRYPDDIWECFYHKSHGSVDWKKKNYEEIKKLTIENVQNKPK